MFTATFIPSGYLFPTDANEQDVPDKLFIQLGNLFCLHDSDNSATDEHIQVNMPALFNTLYNV